MKNYEPMHTRQQIADVWGTTANNIGKTYANNPDKQKQYRLMDICVIIEEESIKIEDFLFFLKTKIAAESGCYDMTKNEIKEFKKFKEFQNFKESSK